MPPKSDTWYGIEDKRLRKRIQDRLAQRARRQRLQKSKKDGPYTDSMPGDRQVSSLLDNHSHALEPSLSSSKDLATASALALGKDEHHLSRPGPSIFTALFNNGRLLGLHCSYCGVEKSKPVQFSVPISLLPTPLQLDLPHRTFIDRFPFPLFRNNLIYFDALIDMEQFLDDLFNLHSFSLVSGRAPWDPTAWQIGPDFEKKWGYLFYGEIS